MIQHHLKIENHRLTCELWSFTHSFPHIRFRAGTDRAVFQPGRLREPLLQIPLFSLSFHLMPFTSILLVCFSGRAENINWLHQQSVQLSDRPEIPSTTTAACLGQATPPSLSLLSVTLQLQFCFCSFWNVFIYHSRCPWPVMFWWVFHASAE